MSRAMTVRSMIVRPTTILTLVAMLAATLALGTSSAGAGPSGFSLVEATDKAGDVRLLGPAGNERFRRSIDIRRLSMTDRGSAIRITVKLAGIRRDRDAVQLVAVKLRPAPGSGERWRAEAGFSPQWPTLGFASIRSTGGRVTACDPLATRTKRRSATVSMDVPKQCLPTSATRIVVTTTTGFFRSDGGAYSRDVLPVPGTHVLMEG